MAADSTAMENEIQRIVRDGEDVRHGWSDRQIVEEAARRAGGTGDAESGRWNDVIATIRSQSDNDGQERG